MKLIKKSGRVEEFSIEKVRNSMAAASDEANQPLNESDLKRLSADLMEILEGKETVKAHQIIIIVTGLLYTKGFYGVIDSYLSYKRTIMK